jgi:hypothetical protein
MYSTRDYGEHCDTDVEEQLVPLFPFLSIVVKNVYFMYKIRFAIL